MSSLDHNDYELSEVTDVEAMPADMPALPAEPARYPPWPFAAAPLWPDELEWLERDDADDIAEAQPVRRRSPILWGALIGLCAGTIGGLAFVGFDAHQRANLPREGSAAASSHQAVASPTGTRAGQGDLPARAPGTGSHGEAPAATPASVAAPIGRQVRVMSQPAGATLIVVRDGVLSVVGTTPVDVIIDPAQRNEIVLTLAGYTTRIAPLRSDLQELVLELAPR